MVRFGRGTVDFEITITEQEHRAGAPSGGQVAEAAEHLRERGLVVVKDALPKDLVSELLHAYVGRFEGLSEDELRALGSRVGPERWMLSLPFEAPFDRSAVYAPPMLAPILEEVLGPDLVLSSYCAVTAYPGADHQHLHRDHPFLFPEDEDLSFSVPTYAVTVVVPLIDLDVTTGGTRVWPDSHQSTPGFWNRLTQGVGVRLPAGSAFVMDYRLLHGGEPNEAHIPRPVLYLSYARPWFRDAANFRSHPAVRMSQAALARVPEAHRRLFEPVVKPG